MDFQVLNYKLVRINHAFALVRNCMQAIGQIHCKVMSIADLKDTHHTCSPTPDSQIYYRIMSFYDSPSYFYLRLGMGLNA